MERLGGLRVAVAIIIALVVFGTVGYAMLEGWSLLDSFYMVVITLSTVGYGEVRPLSAAGRLLSILLILGGIGTLGYAAGSFSRIIIEGELRRSLGRRRMEREVSKMQGHYIVCGFGRVGRGVCAVLAGEGRDLVVVDVEQSTLDDVARKGFAHVRGDATEEETLRSAGIEEAAALILTLSHEADNVYVTLLAKELRPDLKILARSATEQGERRLRAAGADGVVSPERIGAHRMAQSVLRPTVVEFMEVATEHHDLELQIDEVMVSEEAPLVGRSIAQCNIRQVWGLIVVALVDEEGKMQFNPSPEQQITAGTTLILLGRRDDLTRFAADNRAVSA